jgi:hypothetical protein
MPDLGNQGLKEPSVIGPDDLFLEPEALQLIATSPHITTPVPQSMRKTVGRFIESNPPDPHWALEAQK